MTVTPIYKVKYPIQVFLDKEELRYDIGYFTILSKRELLDLASLYLKDNKITSLYKLKVVETALSDREIINYLSDKEIDILFEEIMKKSNVTIDEIKKLEDLFWLLNDKNLKSDTWKCENCKELGLQESRGCKFLPKEKREKIQIYAGGKLWDYCPIYEVEQNKELITNAFEAYRLYDKGLLPEQGSIYDQTTGFIEYSNKVASLVKELEARELKKDK